MDIFALAAHFTGYPIGQVRPYGRGHINDTYLVTVAAPRVPPFLLQRLNPRVFPSPDLVMANLRVVTAHLQARLQQAPLPGGRRWEVPRLLPTRQGQDSWPDPHGVHWRALSFIAPAQSFDTVSGPAQAHEVGWALGLFHRLLGDLPASRLADTLPGFHITPGYLDHYDAVLAAAPPRPSPGVDFCHTFIAARRDLAGVLEAAKARGALALRPIHGDPKVANVLFDPATGQAISLIDLDTVKPGLLHYDLGDCLRSACNPRGEDSDPLAPVSFDLHRARALLTGYLSQAREILTPADYDLLFPALRLIPFELGLRFFTDYLEGDVYFKARYPDHNLARTLVQFRLVESIEGQEAALLALLRELR